MRLTDFQALIAAAEAGDRAAVRRLDKARPDLFIPHPAGFCDSAAPLRRAASREPLRLKLAACGFIDSASFAKPDSHVQRTTDTACAAFTAYFR